jgi:hypothetical protein
MNDSAEVERVARAWLARTEGHKRRVSEVLVWLEESDCERCYEATSVLMEVMAVLEADRVAAAAVLEVVVGRDAGRGGRTR